MNQSWRVSRRHGEPKVIEPRRRFSLREILDSKLSLMFPKLDMHPGVSFKYLMAF